MKKHCLIPNYYIKNLAILGCPATAAYILVILKFVSLAFEQNIELLILPAMFIGGIILVFVTGWDGFCRMSARVSINQDGIICYHLFARPDFMSWDSIKIYGIHASNTNIFNEKFVFFSSEKHIKALRFRDPLKLTKTHYAIWASHEMLNDLYTYMPHEMQKKVNMGIEKDWEMCWHRTGQRELAISNGFYNPIEGLSDCRIKNNFVLWSLMDKNWKEYKKRNKME